MRDLLQPRPGGASKLICNGLLTVADELSASGGAELAQLRIIEGLASSGWDVELLYFNGGNLWPRWNACTSSVRSVRASPWRRVAPLRSARETLSLTVAIRQSGSAVSYLHDPGKLPAALMGSKLNGTPVALHLHLPPPFRQPRWLNRLIRKADAIIAPSVDTAERWMRAADLSSGRISVIPTGTDTDHFIPLAGAARHGQRKSLGLDPDVPMVLYAGRLHHTKGLYELLEGVGRMSERVNLVICGAGDDASFVDALHRDAAGMDVTWLDWRLDISSLLAAADLLVLPSLFDEPQGMVVIEAMSCGTPAVATAVGGLPETLVAFPDHLVPAGDAVALASAMDRLVGWRRHAPTLGEDARQWVLEHATLQRSVEAVSMLLANLVR
jgi:glycosyltransferase involved in cell wall biosynthesis